MGARNSILILGGGASGVILAANLLRSPDPDLHVTIVERRLEFGRGQAYSTDLPDHTLNVCANGMSAIADDPDHLLHWLQAAGLAADGSDYFAPRGLYGDYLGSMLDKLVAAEAHRLRLVHAEVTRITPSAVGVAVELGDGSSIAGHKAVLAFGHGDARQSARAHAIRFDSPEDTPFDFSRDVLVWGTGLSMVDTWLSLQHRGHTGRVIAVSRRGLTPLPHQPGNPIAIDEDDVPFGADVSRVSRWLRQLARDSERRGGSWRDAVDGLRPHNQRIWQSWTPAMKRRFLRHAKSWWDVHRHRMPQHIHARIAAAMKSGRLLVVAGRVHDISKVDEGYSASIGMRSSKAEATHRVARIYDCTGVAKSIADGASPVLRSLFEHGHARPDAFGIGLDVTDICAVIGADGLASAKLYAVGPLTRGQFFEIEAIPDIRVQCAALAKRLAGDSAP